MYSLEILAAVMPASNTTTAKFAVRYCDHLNAAADEYEINTPQRAAHFIAQLAQESGELRYARELWGPTAQQLRYERNFNAPWNRTDPTNALAFGLGNSEAGDGARFMGRGLIQLTGRFNYTKFSRILFGSEQVLLARPEMLEQPELATRSAGAYWVDRGCNELADKNDGVTITRRINGGLTHYDRRMLYLSKAVLALGA